MAEENEYYQTEIEVNGKEFVAILYAEYDECADVYLDDLGEYTDKTANLFVDRHAGVLFGEWKTFEKCFANGRAWDKFFQTYPSGQISEMNIVQYDQFCRDGREVDEWDFDLPILIEYEAREILADGLPTNWERNSYQYWHPVNPEYAVQDYKFSERIVTGYDEFVCVKVGLFIDDPDHDYVKLPMYAGQRDPALRLVAESSWIGGYTASGLSKNSERDKLINELAHEAYEESELETIFATTV